MPRVLQLGGAHKIVDSILMAYWQPWGYCTIRIYWTMQSYRERAELWASTSRGSISKSSGDYCQGATFDLDGLLDEVDVKMWCATNRVVRLCFFHHSTLSACQARVISPETSPHRRRLQTVLYDNRHLGQRIRRNLVGTSEEITPVGNHCRWLDSRITSMQSARRNCFASWP